MNKDYRLELSKDDVNMIFKIYNAKGTGELDYDEFLRLIRVLP
jgi:Ca2+-binding EF-hand superfamily protein